MSRFAMPSLLARFKSPRRRPLRALEPADMGTAFGMEQWLHERDHGAPPAPQRVTNPDARPWLPRWLNTPLVRRARG